MNDTNADKPLPFPDELIDSYVDMNRKHIFKCMDTGLLFASSFDDDLFLAKRFSKIIRAELNWFENIIKHQPSVGYFYENLLKNTLSQFIPAKFNIGTGFVYNLVSKRHSKQIDILLYKNDDSAPLYSNGDFVIVTPENVTSLIEVKKTLRKSDIKNILDKTMTFLSGTSKNDLEDVQYINIFAYACNIPISKLAKYLIDQIDNILDKFIIKEQGIVKGAYGMKGIVLPRIFILDERNQCFINSSLKSTDNLGQKISIEVLKTFSDDVLGDFFSHVIPNSRDKSSMNYNGISHHIYDPQYEFTSTNEIVLFSYVTIQEIANHFKDNINEIRNLRINDKIPYAALVPDKKWRDIKNFRIFLKIKGLQFMSLSENTIKEVEQNTLVNSKS